MLVQVEGALWWLIWSRGWGQEERKGLGTFTGILMPLLTFREWELSKATCMSKIVPMSVSQSQ